MGLRDKSNQRALGPAPALGDTRQRTSPGKLGERSRGELFSAAEPRPDAAFRPGCHEYYRSDGHHQLHRHQCCWHWTILLQGGGYAEIITFLHLLWLICASARYEICTLHALCASTPIVVLPAVGTQRRRGGLARPR